LSSNEGNNMKGARRRKPVRNKRIIRLTLIASAFYAVFAMRSAFAQPSQSSSRQASAFDRPDTSWASSSGSGYVNPDARENTNSGGSNTNTRPQKNRGFDGRFMRAQHRMGKQSGNTQAQQMPVMQPPPVDSQPPERPPRHGVMTVDERRLLRQHIEEAVRDLYKR
jgi:hypothetical protein